MFTCLSCTIAFSAADDQRTHYRSDLHRYNMKRRVAGLPPITAALFAQRCLDRAQDSTTPEYPSRCDLCGKTYATENAYKSHLSSKKHKENAGKAPSLTPPNVSEHSDVIGPAELSCLFCTVVAASLQDNLSHMSSRHSFFIPDTDYLVDLPGLINHLSEKIAVHNMCIYCSGKGRELRTPQAVRQHMLDKGHCKIAYDTEIDRLSISDYYNFSSSYPSESPAIKKIKNKATIPDDDMWEDIDDDVDADQVVDVDSDVLPDTQLAYGDTEYELVLPSGARIGHRSMMRYYAQSFHGIPVKPQDPNSGAALVRRLLAGKNSALVPLKGGFGAFGQGTQVIKARNKGEAHEAGRHIREFRDQRRREDFKTKVAFVHNNQKHFRDPLLQ